MLTVKNSALKSPLRSSDKQDIDYSLTDYWIRWQSLPMHEMLYSFVQSTAFVAHPEHKTDRSHLNGKTVAGSKISKWHTAHISISELPDPTKNLNVA